MPYPLALALTLTVEVPVYTAALLTAGLARGWRLVAVAVGVNLATHPLVWLALRGAGPAYWPRFVLVEVVAWLTEAALVFFLLVRREARLTALVALAANSASALAGLLLSLTTP